MLGVIVAAIDLLSSVSLVTNPRHQRPPPVPRTWALHQVTVCSLKAAASTRGASQVSLSLSGCHAYALLEMKQVTLFCLWSSSQNFIVVVFMLFIPYLSKGRPASSQGICVYLVLFPTKRVVRSLRQPASPAWLREHHRWPPPWLKTTLRTMEKGRNVVVSLIPLIDVACLKNLLT